MGKLERKIALITGAASGIGRASAVLFAQEGAAVVVADIDRRGGEETVKQIVTAGGVSIFVPVDVTRADSVREMVEAAASRFGRLDILFNNAGIGGDYAPLAQCAEESFDRVIAVNLKGVFLGMKFGIPVILEGGGGVVINTASVAGIVGTPGFPAYAASKGGVIQLTKVAALDYAARNVRVNCLCPGVVDTPILRMVPARNRKSASSLHPMVRMAQPQEIARAALFLAGEDSSFATGGAFVIDGGFTAQ